MGRLLPFLRQRLIVAHSNLGRGICNGACAVPQHPEERPRNRLDCPGLHESGGCISVVSIWLKQASQSFKNSGNVPACVVIQHSLPILCLYQSFPDFLKTFLQPRP